jgi:hypothetical protein
MKGTLKFSKQIFTLNGRPSCESSDLAILDPNSDVSLVAAVA